MSYLDEIDYQTSQFAEFYDELPLWSARCAFMILDRVPLRSMQTILDVGAGTGFLSIELAQRCRESTVIAVDPWNEAIERLNRKAAYLGLTNIRTIVGDAANVDLSDASVDLIVSNLGINNFDNPIEVMKTLNRVTRPSATLLLTTNLVGHMAEFYEVFRSVLIELSLQNLIPALEAHIAHRATVDMVKCLLDETGFEFLSADEASFSERYTDGSTMLRHFFIRLGFVQGWKSIVPPDQLHVVFDCLEQRLNELAVKQGGLSLTIPAACIEARRR